MPTLRGKALVGQSGGPTAVINQSLVGIIEAAQASEAIEAVYGAVHGVAGVLGENLIDLSSESRETLERVAATPCAALRSVRKKPTREECQRVIEVLRAHDVRYFFYIGGNDSAETAHVLNELALAEKYEVRLFHVPKTIDNDLRVTDHCPGYGSAARFVASAMIGDDLDNRSLAGIKVNVVMGRHAGWLTAAGALARQNPDDGPHLIYMPERVFDVQSFLADVERVYARLGRCLIAVSEGIHDAAGEPIYSAEGEVDSHGNVQLSGSGALGDWLAARIKQGLGSKLRVRADTFGYLQRSFAGCTSAVDAAEAREVGRTAVREALAGTPHGSIAIRRLGEGAKYRAGFERVELSDVAKVTRPLEERFLAGDNDVSPAFLDYARPLVGPLPVKGRLSEVPVARRLR
jgi:ATP-dependent phosphofructokinase / diphosphate-dependent phosphofructokinase